MSALTTHERRHLGIGLSRQAHQRSDVVSQHLGGHVHKQGLLGQAGDSFQVQPVLEPFERLFDAPALVIQIAESSSMDCCEDERMNSSEATSAGRGSRRVRLKALGKSGWRARCAKSSEARVSDRSNRSCWIDSQY